ncbi:MAG: aspartate ammonia-lyase [Candidatus Omnitrophica bacterium]|nr:aspartate ammonia-lyase [Candidatus Omnitrophota bacterium]
MNRTRLEKDSLGTKRVQASAYYGVQTQRAIENFPISGLHLSPAMVRAMVLIKRAAAETNAGLKLLPRAKANAIVRAANDVLRGRFADQFIVDAFQAGAGTSFHMNVNEVLANRANELLGARRGTYRHVHPNDHVNMAQSTNDVVPTTMRIAALTEVGPLLASLRHLEQALAVKGRTFRNIVKSGRTHLQDAVPVRLGQEFGGYAAAVGTCRERIAEASRRLAELNIGGTAAGTGLNAHPRYRAHIVARLRRATGLPLKPGRNLFHLMQSLGDFVRLSSTLRELAVELIRIANDLRLLSSGPRTGLAEIKLPAVQPGSSIMPGKVNPVMAEMLTQVCWQVLGNDLTIAAAAQAGQLELNVMMPVVAYNLLQSIEILTTSTRVFTERCVRGIVADRARCAWYADHTVSLATALNPKIGYAKTAALVKEAIRLNRSIRELAVARGHLSRAAASRLLDPARLTQPSSSQVHSGG